MKRNEIAQKVLQNELKRSEMTRNKQMENIGIFSHNPEVAGSSPVSATKKEQSPSGDCSFFCGPVFVFLLSGL